MAARLRAIRRRLRWAVSLRTLWVGLGAAAFLLALGAWWAAPVASPILAAGVWALALGLGGSLGLVLGRLPRRWRGSDAAGVLAEAEPGLVSRVRSVVELAKVPAAARTSPPLVHAHASAVWARLQPSTPLHLLPWQRLWPAKLRWAGALCVLGAALLTAHGRTASGLYALLHPALGGGQKGVKADMVAALRLEVRPPDYLRQTAAVWRLGDKLPLPVMAGSHVRLVAKPRLPVTTARVQLGKRSWSLPVGEDGSLRGRLPVLQSGALQLWLHRDGRWLRHHQGWPVRLERDPPPELRLLAPRAAAVRQKVHEVIALRYRVRDNSRVQVLRLAVQVAGAAPQYQRMAVPQPAASLVGARRVVPSRFGARAGDLLQVWLEAHDDNDVTGPGVGRSRSLEVTLVAPVHDRAAVLTGLTRALHRSVDALAVYLHGARAASRADPTGLARLSALSQALRQLLDAEHKLAPTHPVRIRHHQTALSAVERWVRRLKSAPNAGTPRLVTRLEKLALTLDDLRTAAALDDAVRRTHALDLQSVAIQRSLAAAADAGRERFLPQDLHRLRHGAHALTGKVDHLRRRVPAEHWNRDALADREVLRHARQAARHQRMGELASADQALTRLQHANARLRRALLQGQSRFAQQRLPQMGAAAGGMAAATAALHQAQTGVRVATAGRKTSSQDASTRDNHIAQQQAAQSKLARQAAALGRRGATAAATRAALKAAEAAMQRAAGALGARRVAAALDAQDEALERLAAAQKAAAQAARATRQGAGATGTGETKGRTPVAIPHSQLPSSLRQRRQRILEALQGPLPPGHDRAVRHYYKELLR